MDVISNINKYRQIVEDNSVYDIDTGLGGVNEGVIIQVFEDSKTTDTRGFTNGWIKYEVLVSRKTRGYAYETTSSYDEGWGLEEGDFYDKETVKIPPFVFTLKELNTDTVLLELKKLKMIDDIARLEKDNEYLNTQIKNNDEKLISLREELGL